MRRDLFVFAFLCLTASFALAGFDLLGDEAGDSALLAENHHSSLDDDLSLTLGDSGNDAVEDAEENKVGNDESFLNGLNVGMHLRNSKRKVSALDHADWLSNGMEEEVQENGVDDGTDPNFVHGPPDLDKIIPNKYIEPPVPANYDAPVDGASGDDGTDPNAVHGPPDLDAIVPDKYEAPVPMGVNQAADATGDSQPADATGAKADLSQVLEKVKKGFGNSNLAWDKRPTFQTPEEIAAWNHGMELLKKLPQDEAKDVWRKFRARSRGEGEKIVTLIFFFWMFRF